MTWPIGTHGFDIGVGGTTIVTTLFAVLVVMLWLFAASCQDASYVDPEFWNLDETHQNSKILDFRIVLKVARDVPEPNRIFQFEFLKNFFERSEPDRAQIPKFQILDLHTVEPDRVQSWNPLKPKFGISELLQRSRIISSLEIQKLFWFWVPSPIGLKFRNSKF